MANLKYLSRDPFNQDRKPNVYFCCHSEDFRGCFDALAQAILSEADCLLWYCDSAERDQDFLEDLASMQLVVVPVTYKLLNTSNYAIEQELSMAQKLNIPILPIMLEQDVEDAFYRQCGTLCGIKLADIGNLDDQFAKELRQLLAAYLEPKAPEGSWIFLSHSSADIEKVRMIRNAFERQKQNPLAFHLKCLRTDTKKGCRELEGLIQREIDARDWFVFCESEDARKSSYVNMEKDYVIKCGKKKIYTIDMSLPMEEILEKVEEICADVRIFISYPKRTLAIVRILAQQLMQYDFDVWYDERLLPGESFQEIIAGKIEAVTKYGFFVAIITEDYEQSYCGMYELPTALMNGTRIIPIVIGDAEIPLMLKQHICYRLPNYPQAEDMKLIADLIEAETRLRIQGPLGQDDAYQIIAEVKKKLNCQ